jgi:hydroxyacylglutathione hydrolase
MTLPPETRVYCAHEYTQANGQFAMSVEPSNQNLISRMAEIDAKRAQNIPTVPSKLGEELATNPFLRPDSIDLQRSISMEGSDSLNVFAEIRQRKDKFNADNRK